eukprot:TCALIF_01770-PA protein Name:"Protein of unknown function" AED:0.02 eAED:0.02 QI:0/0.5/0.33/0.66/1/1/3/62/470
MSFKELAFNNILRTNRTEGIEQNLLLSDDSNIRLQRAIQSGEQNLIRAVASNSNDLSLYSAIEEFISDEIDQIENELQPQKSSSVSTSNISTSQHKSKPNRNKGGRIGERRSQSQKHSRRRKTKLNRSRRRHVRRGGNQFRVDKTRKPQRKRHTNSLSLDALVGKDPEGPFAAGGGTPGTPTTSFKFRPQAKLPKRRRKKLPVQPTGPKNAQNMPELRSSVSQHVGGKQVLGPVYKPRLKHLGKSTPLPYPEYKPRTRPQRHHHSHPVRYTDLVNRDKHHPSEVGHFTSTLSSGKKYKGFRPSPPDLYRNYLTRPSDPDIYLNTHNNDDDDATNVDVDGNDIGNDYHPHQDFKLPFPTSLTEMIKISDVESGFSYGHNLEDHKSEGPVAEYGPTIFLPIVPLYNRPSYTHVVSNQIGKDTHSALVEERPLDDKFETLYYPGTPRTTVDYSIDVHHGSAGGFSYQKQSIGE